MISELGLISLILATGLAVLQFVYPMVGAFRNDERLLAMGRPLVFAQFGFALLSYALLTYAFIVNDFTVAYVANNSNSALPLMYRFSAVWGAHEGSLLLWALLLTAWTLVVALRRHPIEDRTIGLVLSIMGALSVGFYLFILLTSNPFETTLPHYPIDGRDLNPLLQDPGLIFHPPILYMGYVGFAVAFAFAIAALINGKLDKAWTQTVRPYTSMAWVFLTIGIALGSWWAYYELGWGGWWFWDPVENASFMPWIAGTALMHSLAVNEKRGVLTSWTILLAITAFSLSLLGTFLVRSGILVSVHAFASDPARGLFILAFLMFVVGGSLALFALRGGLLTSNRKFGVFSRETLLLFNNLLLMAALLTVLLGTLMPLVHKELGLGTISIGAPFFNQIFSLLVIPFAVLLGITPMVRWKKQDFGPLVKPLIFAGIAAAILAVPTVMHFGQMQFMPLLGCFLGYWIITTSIAELIMVGRTTGKPAMHRPKRHWAMFLGHLGFAMMVLGISVTENYNVERDVRMGIGDSVELSGYRFFFDSIVEVDGPNYDAYKGKFHVDQNGRTISVLGAEKRMYHVQRMPMTEAAIDWGFTRDLYIALGEPFDDGTWALRIYYKPGVRWIWWGAVVMGVGGILALPARRKVKAKQEEKASARPAAEGADA